MRNLKFVTLVVALAGLLFTSTASAGGEVSAEGWSIFLPDGFQSAPTSVGARLGSKVRRLVASTGVQLTGSPETRQFVRLGPGGEEATILVLRYQLPAQSHLKSVNDLEFESVKRAVTLTAQSGGELEIYRVEQARFNANLEGIKFTVVERGETGDEGEFRFAISIHAGAVVVVVLRAQDWARFDVPQAWQKSLASLQISRPEPGIDRWFWFGGVALCVALFGVTVVFLLRRRGGDVRPSAIVIEPSMQGAEGFVDSGSRAMDGLPTFAGDSFSAPPTPPPPRRTNEPGRPPPAPSPIPGLTPDLPDISLPPPVREEDAPVRPQQDYGGGAEAPGRVTSPGVPVSSLAPETHDPEELFPAVGGVESTQYDLSKQLSILDLGPEGESEPDAGDEPVETEDADGKPRFSRNDDYLE